MNHTVHSILRGKKNIFVTTKGIPHTTRGIQHTTRGIPFRNTNQSVTEPIVHGVVNDLPISSRCHTHFLTSRNFRFRFSFSHSRPCLVRHGLHLSCVVCHLSYVVLHMSLCLPGECDGDKLTIPAQLKTPN